MPRAEYMRQYRKDRPKRDEQKAFAAGFQALRMDLIKTFGLIGRGEMNGNTAAEIVRNSKPHVPRET